MADKTASLNASWCFCANCAAGMRSKLLRGRIWYQSKLNRLLQLGPSEEFETSASFSLLRLVGRTGHPNTFCFHGLKYLLNNYLLNLLSINLLSKA